MSHWVRAVPACVIVLAVLAAVPALLSAQCAMCKEALEGGQALTGDDGLARGFAYSIYLMVSLPFVLFGSIAFLVWRSYRRPPASAPAAPPGA